MTIRESKPAIDQLGFDQGILVQMSVSEGGVPKTSVNTAHVTSEGIVGDAQRNRKFHGGPDRALCIWSVEIIRELRQEGHALEPGYTGENLTLGEIPWDLIKPGRVLKVGGDVLVEIASYARPCKTNARWFIDGDFRRIDEAKHPGYSRVYARVLAEGELAVGDLVELL